MVKNILKKVALAVCIFMLAFVGGVAGDVTTDTLQGADYRLCKAETMNDCLIAGGSADKCMVEARDECD